MTPKLPFPKSFPTKEETKFLQMLLSNDSDFPKLWKEWKDTVVWEELDPATSRLLPLAYLRIKKLNITDEITARVKGIYKSAWVKNQRLLHVVKQVAETCDKEHIPLMLLKGMPLILEVYRDPGARFLGDADILIPPEHGPRIIQLLKKSGWSYAHPWVADNHNPVPSVFTVIKSTELVDHMGVEMDVHWNIFAANHGVTLPRVFLLGKMPTFAFREYFWKHTIPMTVDGVPCKRLSNEDMLIHIIVHGAEGNTHRALRWVTDAITTINTLPIDWEVVIKHAEQFGFAIELKLGFAYITKHFDTPIPDSFMQQLSLLPITKAKLQKYYKIANTEHSRRINILGNIPLLWYAYFKFEPGVSFPKNIFGFFTYLRKSWGLESYRKVVAFAIHHYKRKLETKDPTLLDGTKKAFFDSAYIISGKAVSFMASFAVITVLSRALPRETAGSYNYIIATLAIVSITTLPGMNNALTRAIAKGNHGSLPHMLRKRLTWGILGSVIALIIGVISWAQGNTAVGIAFLVAAPFVPLTDTFSTFALNYWQGKKRFDKSALMGALYYVLLALLSLPVIIFSHNLIIIVLGVMIAQTASGLLIYRSIKKESGERDHASEKLGIHLTFIQALHTIAAQADKIIIWHLFGASFTAIYTFASTPVSKANQMIPIGIISLPHLSQQEFTPPLKRQMLKKTFALFLVSFPLTLAVILLAPFLYKIFFPSYPESIRYFQFLMMPVALAPMAILKSSFTAFNKTRELYLSETSGTIIRILLMLIFALFFGLFGIVIGILISAVIDLCITLLLFTRAKTV